MYGSRSFAYAFAGFLLKAAAFPLVTVTDLKVVTTTIPCSTPTPEVVTTTVPNTDTPTPTTPTTSTTPSPTVVLPSPVLYGYEDYPDGYLQFDIPIGYAPFSVEALGTNFAFEDDLQFVGIDGAESSVGSFVTVNSADQTITYIYSEDSAGSIQTVNVVVGYPLPTVTTTLEANFKLYQDSVESGYYGAGLDITYSEVPTSTPAPSPELGGVGTGTSTTGTPVLTNPLITISVTPAPSQTLSVIYYQALSYGDATFVPESIYFEGVANSSTSTLCDGVGIGYDSNGLFSAVLNLTTSYDTVNFYALATHDCSESYFASFTGSYQYYSNAQQAVATQFYSGLQKRDDSGGGRALVLDSGRLSKGINFDLSAGISTHATFTL